MRTARVGLRLTPAQRERCFGLLACAGDVWACVLDMNRWRRQRGLPAVASYQELCRAPKRGQVGSRRWRKFRARQRKLEARHKRRVKQAQHEAAKTVVEWAVKRRVGTLVVGDPRGVLVLKAGRRHNQRVRDWRVGYLLRCLKDKAEQAGIRLVLVDERGTSSRH